MLQNAIKQLEAELQEEDKKVLVAYLAELEARLITIRNAEATLENKLNEEKAKVVLQNVLVSAVDLQSVKPEDKQGMVPSTVTLEVTPQEALLLARVEDTGSLILSLRSVGDTSVGTCQSRSASTPTPAATTT